MTEETELHCARCKQPIERGYYGTGTAMFGEKEVCLDCARILFRKEMREAGRFSNLRLVSLMSTNWYGKSRWSGWRLWFAYVDMHITINQKNMRVLKDGRTRIWFKFNGEVWTGLMQKNTLFVNVHRTKRTTLPDVGK